MMVYNHFVTEEDGWSSPASSFFYISKSLIKKKWLVGGRLGSRPKGQPTISVPFSNIPWEGLGVVARPSTYICCSFRVAGLAVRHHFFKFFFIK